MYGFKFISYREEEQRSDHFVTTVREYLRTSNPELKFIKFTIKNVEGAEEKVSPFSGGGGDNVLLGWPLEKTLVVTRDRKSSSESSPVDDGKQRLGTDVELKDLTSQSDELKANMHLLSSSLAVAKLEELEKIERPITWLKELKTFTSYGLSFGVVKPLVLLKLTIDFTNEQLVYEKRYESTIDVHKAPRLACAMQYLITKMTSPSPEPEELPEV